MKILIVGNLYPPVVFGGYEILCHQVVERLRSRGHQLEVVCSQHGADRAAWQPGVERTLELTTDFPNPGQKVDRVDFHPASLARVTRHNHRRIASVADRFRPDLVFAWCLNRLGLAALMLAQERRLACCYTLNDEHCKQFRPSPGRGPKAMFKRWLERTLWRGSTLASLRPFPVTAISYALRDRLLEQGVPVAHARIIHQGIPLDNFPFQPLARRPEEPLRVLYVGQLSQAKGCHTLVRAFQGPNLAGKAELNLIGDGVPDYEQHLRELASQSANPERIRFLGRLPHSEVSRHYREHHVLVFPSEWEEPFGLTHLEAMASGCAVCSTTTGGSKELIRHERNALSFAAGQASELAHCLERLHGDESFRQQLVQGGREWVKAHHSLDSYVSKLELFLQACLKR